MVSPIIHFNQVCCRETSTICRNEHPWFNSLKKRFSNFYLVLLLKGFAILLLLSFSISQVLVSLSLYGTLLLARLCCF